MRDSFHPKLSDQTIICFGREMKRNEIKDHLNSFPKIELALTTWNYKSLRSMKLHASSLFVIALKTAFEFSIDHSDT